MKQKSLGKQDNLNEKSASTGFPHLGYSWAAAALSRFRAAILSWEGRWGKEERPRIYGGGTRPACPPRPSPPTALSIAGRCWLRKPPALWIWPSKGSSPLAKPRTMLSSLLRSLKRSREEETPVELQPDCDWCVPISSSLLSLWMARTASGL